jgi:hypothetical protein
MLDWLKRKAAEKQEANFRTSLARLISAANDVYAAMEFVGDSSAEQKRRIRDLQTSLAYDFAGPIPAPELKRRLIDPALDAPGVSEGARLAVMHVYDSVVRG